MKGPGSWGWKSTPPEKPASTCSRMRCVSSTGAAWVDQNSTWACAAPTPMRAAVAAPAKAMRVLFISCSSLVGSEFPDRFGHRPVAGAQDEFRRDQPGARLGRFLLDDVDQHPRDLAGPVARMGLEGGEAGRRIGGGGDVVEAHH